MATLAELKEQFPDSAMFADSEVFSLPELQEQYPDSEMFSDNVTPVYLSKPEEPAPIEYEDPTWGDYGRMVVAGGIQLGGGIGWLANKFGIDAGATLQKAASDKVNSIMEGLTDDAKNALAVEFTSRDDGELWTDRKWRKAKLTAAQSLLGTLAGMGVGSLLTKGLAVAGMSKIVTTAAGEAVQAPSTAASAIGFGLGEASVSAPGTAADAENQVRSMSTDQLMEDSAEFRAILANLDTPDPERARDILAKAIGGDVFYGDMLTTFLLSAPFGVLVKGFAGKVPLATTRLRSVGVGAGGEAGQEFLQSGAEQGVSNLGLQRADPSIPLSRGVAEQAVGGALAGGMMGAGPGLISPLEAPPVDPEDDALDAQLNADLTPEELDQAGDALSSQIEGAQSTQKAIEALLQSDLVKRREAELAGTELEVAEADRQERIADEQRSSAFLQAEQQRDARLEAQRREAEYQQELQKGEEAELLAEHEAPGSAPAAVSDEVELATKPSLKTALAPALQEAYEKQQAKEKKQLETVGKEVEAEPLVAPEKPETSKATKALNTARDSLLTIAAKSPVNRRLSQKAFAAEGLDIEDLRTPIYKGRPGFSKHKDAMTPDDVAEYLNEQGYPTKDGKPWDANSALEAVRAEVEGGEKIFTSQGMETAETERGYQEALSEFDQATERRATVGAPKVHEITVDGIEARISEEPEGEIEITIDGAATITTRKKGETNADLVRVAIAAQPKTALDAIEESRTEVPPESQLFEDVTKETEAETEAREEREAMQADDTVVEEAESEIPGFDEEVHEAATSPKNDLPQPTEGQKEAGNYKKGHTNISGLDVTIENPKGSTRRGMKQKDHYGYIKRTEGADGDQVDVFVNPKVVDDFEGTVYVIDQTQEDGETFDEHKVMLGYKNKLDALRGYKRNYTKGWHVGPVTEMTLEEFKTWLKGDTTTPVTEGKKSSRQERKFVRDKKGHLRYSLPRAKKALLEDAQATVPGVDMAFVEQVVGAPSEKSDPAMHLIAEQIAKLQEARAAAKLVPLTKSQADAAIAPALKKLPVLNVEVYESLDAMPESALKEKIKKGFGAKAKAIFDIPGDKIYLFADKHLTAEQAVASVLHEGVAHKGLRTLYSDLDAFNALLEDVYANASDKEPFVRLRKNYKQGDRSEQKYNRLLAEEYIAWLAEYDVKSTLYQRVLASVRKQLRRIGVIKKWTANDINALLRETRSALKTGKPVNEVILTEEVQVEETGEVFDVETNAEVVLRQHDKRVGVIEKLKACL